MVKVDGVNLNITPELQELLKANPDKPVQKAVILKKKDTDGNLVQDTDADGNPKFISAVQSTHPKVYFDAYGNFYLRVFRSKVVDGKEILVTNTNIETDKDCTLYGKGLESHRQSIPGSELWDNGSDTSMVHRELICKGDPLTKIVKVMTREQVLNVSLKPQGNSILAQIANASDAEKAAILEQLSGKKDNDNTGDKKNK